MYSVQLKWAPTADEHHFGRFKCTNYNFIHLLGEFRRNNCMKYTYWHAQLHRTVTARIQQHIHSKRVSIADAQSRYASSNTHSQYTVSVRINSTYSQVRIADAHSQLASNITYPSQSALTAHIHSKHSQQTFTVTVQIPSVGHTFTLTLGGTTLCPLTATLPA